MSDELGGKPASLQTTETNTDPPTYQVSYNGGVCVGGSSQDYIYTLTPPPSPNGFPTTTFTLSGSTKDGQGNTSYNTNVTLNGTASSSGVPVKIVVTNPPGGSFDALLTITVIVEYGSGKP